MGGSWSCRGVGARVVAASTHVGRIGHRDGHQLNHALNMPISRIAFYATMGHEFPPVLAHGGIQAQASGQGCHQVGTVQAKMNAATSDLPCAFGLWGRSSPISNEGIHDTLRAEVQANYKLHGCSVYWGLKGDQLGARTAQLLCDMAQQGRAAAAPPHFTSYK